MGADMIGYFLNVPKLTYAQILSSKINALIEAVNANAPASSVAASLIAMGVNDYIYESELEGEDDHTGFVRYVKEAIDVARQFDLHHQTRDMITQELRINGEDVVVVFCGEMTWGDEPSYDGYQMLKAIDNLGISDAFHGAIHWTATPPTISEVASRMAELAAGRDRANQEMRFLQSELGQLIEFPGEYSGGWMERLRYLLRRSESSVYIQDPTTAPAAEEAPAKDEPDQ